MDNMPYKPIEQFYFTELSEFDRLVMPHVPGVQAPIYELQREETIREFCRRSGALIGQHHPITIYEETDLYPLDGTTEVMDVLTLKEMRFTDNGRVVNNKAYKLDLDRTTFTLQSNWAGGLDGSALTPVISMTMAREAERIESDFFDRWSDGIAAGIIKDLMIVPNKQWTNPQAAGFYDTKYEAAIANAKIAVSRSFGKTAFRVTGLHFE
jgi:hypothetical protein